jgi:uncharacterized protein (DUF1697 family)
MTDYVALLRAINVGGHVVKMDHLRQLFESLGFSDVKTVIASGNVVFRSAARNTRTLESTIGRHLQKALGYEVGTFVRSAEELAAVAAHEAFREEDVRHPDASLFVSFLADAPAAAARKTLLSLRTKFDDFHLHQRELYWLRRTRFSDSEFSGGRLEKILEVRGTVRNANTVQRIAALCATRGA